MLLELLLSLAALAVLYVFECVVSRKESPMLVLSRFARQGDDEVILKLPDGSQVRIVVCEVERHRVKIGFEAPESVTILRGEVEDVLTHKRRK